MPSPPIPDVSVIIVNYDAYDELADCLASLERQSLQALETIVIDHDSSADRCRSLAARFPCVRLVPVAANPGFAAGILMR
jgi:GT2 family glycosyltransferase